MFPRTQTMCAWGGTVALLMFFFGLVVANFFPPPHPSLGPEAVAAIYQEHATGIRIGMAMVMISGMFVAPFVAAISVQLRRIESGRVPIMTYTQLSAGTAGIIFFILPGVVFLVTAFRPDRAIELTYLMNDFSWIVTIIPWPSFFIANIAIATAIFNDPHEKPILPRWYAYLNIWVAILLVPGTLLAFIKTGPFAWNGLFPFWVAGTDLFIWYVATLVVLLKAIKEQSAEAA